MIPIVWQSVSPTQKSSELNLLSKVGLIPTRVKKKLTVMKDPIRYIQFAVETVNHILII